MKAILCVRLREILYKSVTTTVWKEESKLDLTRTERAMEGPDA
uniref:Uncharacterized protein n=1 Tax=Anguilla anguilla TaxID=7936 RepID=A0A0E9QN59_ANGAN